MMRLKGAIALATTLALIGAVGSTSALAQAKKKKLSRCKDGEVSKVIDYKKSEGENLPFTIKASLTDKAGDVKAGLGWMAHRRLGNCLACHEVPPIEKMAEKTPRLKVTALNGKSGNMPLGVHGKIGPTLEGVASRYTEGELRMLIVDPKTAYPETIMPAFHKNAGFTRVFPDCKGKTILSAQQVEDVVAYLKTLK